MKNTIFQLQDEFISALIDQKAYVSIFLVNGIQLKGVISCFDQYTVILESETGVGTRQLVYKHAISTIGLLKNSHEHPSKN